MTPAQNAQRETGTIAGFGDQLDPDYKPDASEEFMNSRQLLYFRHKLQSWKESILRDSHETLETMQSEPMPT